MLSVSIVIGYGWVGGFRVQLDTALGRGPGHFIPAGRHILETLLSGGRELCLQRLGLFGLVAGRGPLSVYHFLLVTVTVVDHDEDLFHIFVFGTRIIANVTVVPSAVPTGGPRLTVPSFFHAVVPLQFPGLFFRQKFGQFDFESGVRNSIDPRIHGTGRLAEQRRHH